MVKVIGQPSCSQDHFFSAVNSYYEVTYLWLFVEFFVLDFPRSVFEKF